MSDTTEVVEATAPDWRKWLPTDPTSAHWYRVAELARHWDGAGRLDRAIEASVHAAEAADGINAFTDAARLLEIRAVPVGQIVRLVATLHDTEIAFKWARPLCFGGRI